MSKIRSQEAMIRELDSILKSAKISQALKNAVMEIRAAIAKGDYAHAADVSSVKSFITGYMTPTDPKNFKFNEDHEFNRKRLGDSVYSILDNMHHDLAFATGSMPSGMMAFHSDGTMESRKPARAKKSPTLTEIAREQRAIDRESRERAKKRYG